MRIRSIAAAVLVAAGLSVALTGAAAAGEPDDDITIVTCEAPDGVRPVPPPEKPLSALPAPPAWEPAEQAERGLRVDGVPPDDVHVVPAEPGEPGVGTVRVVPAEPGERGTVVCTAKAPS